MPVLWAVDAGGSTTTTLAGRDRWLHGSVNPHSVGMDEASSTVREVFAALARTQDGAPALGWMATATLDPDDPEPELRRLSAQVRSVGLTGQLVVSNDPLPWLYAPPLLGTGVVLVCGTGSGFLAGNGTGPPQRVGGCEYLGSDEGSAFDLGMAGLRAAIRAADGRAPATSLTPELAAEFGQPPAALARTLAATAFPKAAVARLAPVVCRAWLGGDEAATAAVTAALDELLLGVRAARDRAGLGEGWALAAGGGVLRGCPPLLDALAERARRELGAAQVVPIADPVETVRAALEACTPNGHVELPEAIDGRGAWLLDLEPRPAPPAPVPVRTDPQIRLGMCLAAYGDAGLDAALTGAADAGVDIVDLPTDSTFELVGLRRWADDGEHRAALRDRLRGVTVGCVSNSRDTQLLLGPHGPHTDPVHDGGPDAKRAHALWCALETVRLAADLGAPHARLMFGVPDIARWLSWWGSTASWADNVTAWCTAALPVLDEAARLGVRVLVEPHPKQVAYDPASARQLLDAVAGTAPAANVQLCVDPANLAATGHDPVEAVRGWGPALGAAHAKDLQRHRGARPPRGDGWSRYGPGPAIRFRALGAGELPWPEIVSALLDEDFHGVLYVEHEDALLPRRQGAATSVDRLRELLPVAGHRGRTW